jgi:bla regulator protein blaR1
MRAARPLPIVRTTLRVVAVALVLHGPLRPAQTPGQLPEFEVASIKRNKTNERMYYGLRNASLTVRNMTVMGLIQTAYGKRAFQISGGPAWIASEGFDIEAKAERPQKATHDMLKSLLASRFQLTLHRETKETGIYSLVVARSGLKMKLSADQTEPDKGGPKEMGPGRIVGEGIPMYVIANLLSNMLGRAVINNTGLTGKYDVKLQPLPDSLQLQPDPAEPTTQMDALNFAIIEAVEKQLGLKLESGKAPGEILVIDHVEHPSAN